MDQSPYRIAMSALYQGRQGARPAAANPTSIVCHGLMDATGISFPEAHHDYRQMADLALAGHEIAGFDSVMPEYSVDQEAAALGCTVDWGDRDNMPTAKDFPYADFRDIEVPDNLLEKPSIKVVLEALEYLRRHVGGRVQVIGKVMGPWTLSYHMAGTENFLLQVGLGETDKVRKMMDQLMPVTIMHANAQFQAGADVVCLGDHATRNLVGPNHYRELLLPLHKIIAQEVTGPVILHVCGECSDRLEAFAETGFQAYHFEWAVGPERAVETIGDRMTLYGCVNNAQTLYSGTPEDAYRQARQALAAGVDAVCPECAIPLATPLENLQAVAKAAKDGFPKSERSM
jgi:[methyl-Co(III) methanol-specific corrinoid protein]:coenzyme M methyltransferase